MSIKEFITNKKTIIVAAIIAIALIVLVVILNISRPAPVSVLRTTPIDNTKQVELFDSISIEFERSVSKDDQNNISFNISPSIKNDYSWSNDQVLTITHNTAFFPETEYVFTVLYKDTVIKTIKFTTRNIVQLSNEDQLKDVAQGDTTYANSQDEVAKRAPWLKNLPITTDQYQAVYDGEKNVIRVRAKVNPVDRESFQNEVISTLSEKGVPSSLQIEWIYP